MACPASYQEDRLRLEQYVAIARAEKTMERTIVLYIGGPERRYSASAYGFLSV